MATSPVGKQTPSGGGNIEANGLECTHRFTASDHTIVTQVIAVRDLYFGSCFTRSLCRFRRLREYQVMHETQLGKI